MGNETSITIEDYYAPAVPINYGAQYAKKSLVVAIVLLATAIILFRTVGDLKSIIIGFSCAEGATVIFGLVCLYYGTKMDRKISIEEQATRERKPTEACVALITKQGPDSPDRSTYLFIASLSQEELIETILAIGRTKVPHTLAPEWNSRMTAFRKSVGAHSAYERIKNDERLKEYQWMFEQIDSENQANDDQATAPDISTRLSCFLEVGVKIDINKLNANELKELVLSLGSKERPKEETETFSYDTRRKELCQNVKKHAAWANLKKDPKIIARTALVQEIETA